PQGRSERGQGSRPGQLSEQVRFREDRPVQRHHGHGAPGAATGPFAVLCPGGLKTLDELLVGVLAAGGAETDDIQDGAESVGADRPGGVEDVGDDPVVVHRVASSGSWWPFGFRDASASRRPYARAASCMNADPSRNAERGMDPESTHGTSEAPRIPRGGRFSWRRCSSIDSTCRMFLWTSARASRSGRSCSARRNSANRFRQDGTGRMSCAISSDSISVASGPTDSRTYWERSSLTLAMIARSRIPSTGGGTE